MQTMYNYCPRDGRPFREDEQICPLCDFQRTIEQSPSTRPGLPLPPRKQWRKLLYVKQDYPDNYVDDTFLEELQKNANVRHYEYWSVVLESTIISQHISSIVIFVAVFIYLYLEMLTSHTLITIGTAGSAIGYGFWDWSNTMLTPDSNFQRRKIFKGAVLFFLTLLGLTPILKTLTEKTSEDTIWALTVILFLANLAFHDYGSGNQRNIKYPGSLSTNAAIFASVVLASRFKTNMHVFGLMSFAVQWFALFPMLRRQIRSISSRGNLALTIVLFLTATTLFSQISPAIVVIYIIGMIFLTFVCPFWLIWIQRYKNEIHGPWDEARPKILHGRSFDYN
ncbi:MAG: phosphatidylinositol N-acetylglucosaminyltransferase subunit C [Linnemannia gamsii]|nr:MAG: phosphatidylinositol N-acetylglucosaminyltransferase subunit C [Linnemannia gamsii]